MSYRWVMKAKERGREDHPRRSALRARPPPPTTGFHPARANIVFFGGLISYAIERGSELPRLRRPLHQRRLPDGPGFKTPADLDGLFSGFDPDKRVYDESTWRYQLDREGHPRRDMTLQDPNTVSSICRHYRRYTPDMVERVCGIPRAKFEQVADVFCSASGPEDGTISCAAAQSIDERCAADPIAVHPAARARQRRPPGGGVAALRGHSNVQGATDMGTLYHMLPGYPAMPLQGPHPTLAAYSIASARPAATG